MTWNSIQVYEASGTSDNNMNYEIYTIILHWESGAYYMELACTYKGWHVQVLHQWPGQ